MIDIYIKLSTMFLLGFGIGYLLYGIENAKKLNKIIDWLDGEKYLVDEHSTTMTEEFEREHNFELSRNIMINEIKNKINDIWT